MFLLTWNLELLQTELPEQIFVRGSNILCPKEQVLLNLKFLLQFIRRSCYCLRQNDLFNAGYMLCLFPEHHSLK